MAELQKILTSSLFELMCDNLKTERPKHIPKPASVRSYEQLKIKLAQGIVKRKYSKRPSVRIPDEQL